MLLRLFLRSMSLAAKFGLTIAIARVLGFAAIGEYGLAVAVSVIASKLCGLGFSAEVNRQLSGAARDAAIESARVLRGIYAAFYAIAGLGLVTASLSGLLPGASADLQSLCLVLLVAASEHYALEANTYIFSIHRPREGSTMLFLRTGGWSAIAIVGLLAHVFGDVRMIFVLWILTNVGVIIWAWALLTQTVSRGPGITIPKKDSASTLRTTWLAGLHFYIGGILLAGLQYAERFIASAWLSAAEVGHYVFVWSLANAAQTIAYATVGVIAGPRLARAASGSDVDWRDAFGKSLRSTVGVSVAVAAGIAATSPLLFWLAKERMTPAALATLLVLLVSFLLRSVGDLLWSASVARRARTRIVTGMCSAAAVALPLSLWLISDHGPTRVAFAHLLASISVLLALSWALGGQRAGARDDV